MNSTPGRRSVLLKRAVLGIVAPCSGLGALAVETDLGRSTGIAEIGAAGGLTIPSAVTLNNGEAALSLSNYHDPRFGTYGSPTNRLFGVGIWQGLELFGRYAETPDPQQPGQPTGLRDISLNFKWQLPRVAPNLPLLAIGGTDIAGGARHFRSYYAVASDRIGPLNWSLGAARSVTDSWRLFGSVFGGLEVDLFDTGASLLAESDGVRRHTGIRYSTPRLRWLGDGQVQLTLQRPFGSVDWTGSSANRSAVAIALRIPMGTSEAARKASVAAPRTMAVANTDELASATRSPARVAETSRTSFSATTLAADLRRAGFERVRIGRQADELVVVFENRSYLTDEVDALGIALALAANSAPTDIRDVQAVALKSGLPVSVTSVDAAGYREFLREGNVDEVRRTVRVAAGGAVTLDKIDWLSEPVGDAHPLRIELKPLLNYKVATDIAPFDYSLAANVRASTSLWRGALLYADWVQRAANSTNMEPGQAFADSLHRNGLASLALQQSWWLHPSLFVSLGAGKYKYDYLGTEGQAIWQVPGRDDTVHLKGNALHRYTGTTVSPQTQSLAASYRWVPRTDTWLEGTVQRYSDGASGPALNLTRWFGDVSLNLFLRVAEHKKFVGLEFGIPLTARKTLESGPLRFGGAPRFTLSYRMQYVSGNRAGYLDDSAARPVDLAFRPEIELLNSGRMSLDHVVNHLQRMREAYFVFGRDIPAPFGLDAR